MPGWEGKRRTSVATGGRHNLIGPRPSTASPTGSACLAVPPQKICATCGSDYEHARERTCPQKCPGRAACPKFVPVPRRVSARARGHRKHRRMSKRKSIHSAISVSSVVLCSLFCRRNGHWSSASAPTPSAKGASGPHLRSNWTPRSRPPTRSHGECFRPHRGWG